jgi:hypothetical protein
MAEIGWQADFIEVMFFETYWIRSHPFLVAKRRGGVPVRESAFVHHIIVALRTARTKLLWCE